MELPDDILKIIALTNTTFSRVSKYWNNFWLSKTLFLNVDFSELASVKHEVKILRISKDITEIGDAETQRKLTEIVKKVDYLEIRPKLFNLIGACKDFQHLKIISFHGKYLGERDSRLLLSPDTIIRFFKTGIKDYIPSLVGKLITDEERNLLKSFLDHRYIDMYSYQDLEDVMIFKRYIDTNKITYFTGIYDRPFDLSKVEHVELDICSREYECFRYISKFSNIKSLTVKEKVYSKIQKYTKDTQIVIKIKK